MIRKLCLLRAGTTSMTFGDVGCRGSLESVLRRVTDYSKGDETKLEIQQRSVLKMYISESDKTCLWNVFWCRCYL